MLPHHKASLVPSVLHTSLPRIGWARMRLAARVWQLFGMSEMAKQSECSLSRGCGALHAAAKNMAALPPAAP